MLLTVPQNGNPKRGIRPTNITKSHFRVMFWSFRIDLGRAGLARAGQGRVGQGWVG